MSKLTLQLPKLQLTSPADGIELFLPDEEKCLEYLEKIRWANRVYCPHCGSKNVKKHTPYKRGDAEVQRYMCLNPNCKKTFTVLTGTVFSNQKLKLGEMFYIIWNLPHKSINRIATELGRDYDSIHAFAKKVMEICKSKIDMLKLTGVIKMDEFYTNSGEKGKKGV